MTKERIIHHYTQKENFRKRISSFSIRTEGQNNLSENKNNDCGRIVGPLATVFLHPSFEWACHPERSEG